MDGVTVDTGTHTVAGDLARRDAVAASPAPAPARPSDTAAVRDVVRSAIDHGTRLRIVGKGTWLDAGRPVVDAQPLELDALTGIVDYTPGDLTLTARAGTTLAEIAAATLPNGQWLTLAPWGGDHGSLGAAAATASTGPTGGALGTPRDIVIGVEVVTGTGDVIRGGGRVVKNVAGFDLTRLMIGAWGTLGVLTEVSVRLRGLPEHDVTVAIRLPANQAQLAELLTRLRTASIAPIALELIDASLARRLEVGGEPLLVARLVGNDESVTAQRVAVAELGDLSETDGKIWTTLRRAEPASASVVRLSGPAGRLAEVWATATRLASSVNGGFAHASVLRPVARVVLPNEEDTLAPVAADALRALTREARIFERLPAPLWESLARTAVGDRLSTGVRLAFDPERLLNPGILGEPPA